jgi:glycosyltransferase involved in cell wall biosynthesis
VRVFSQVGLSEVDVAKLGNSVTARKGPIRIISVGRLLHWKGFHLSLQSFAQANLPEAEYWIVGTGVERKRLGKLAQKLGVRNRVTFCGKLSREETLSVLRESHLLVQPSLHESGGWVVTEAMAAGMPVVCLNLGGPATQVTEETGIKVPAIHPKQTVEDLAEAVTKLVSDGRLRERMGKAGRDRVANEYIWAQKGEHLAALYEELAARPPTHDQAKRGARKIFVEST